LAKFVLEQRGVKEGEVSLVFVSLEKIKELNQAYRGENRVTDVLAFTLEERPLLGEVVIAPEVAKSQAQDYGNTCQEEMEVLLIHGMLHLLGYDHERSEDEKKMRKEELKILSDFREEKASG
jgi:probable rRNA maturation factor